MRLIQRYLLRQHLRPAVMAVLALSVVALMSQALSALQFVDARSGALLTMLEVTGLAYPQLLALLLPAALFLSMSMVMRRLVDDREIAVCFASGMDRRSVITSAMAVAGVGMLLSLAMSLCAGPPAARAMRQVISGARADLASAMLRPGGFVQPARGLTFYAQGEDASGSLRNVFLHQNGPNGGSTFSAREGRLVAVRGRPVFVMRDGSDQSFSRDGVLNYVTFDQWTLDLSPLVARAPVHPELSDYDWSDLVARAGAGGEARRRARPMLAEANARIAGALYAPAFALLAVAGSLGRTLGREDGWRGVVVAASAAAAIRIAGFAAEAVSARHVAANLLQYAAPLAAAGLAAAFIFAPPRRPRRRNAAMPAEMLPLRRLGTAA